MQLQLLSETPTKPVNVVHKGFSPKSLRLPVHTSCKPSLYGQMTSQHSQKPLLQGFRPTGCCCRASSQTNEQVTASQVDSSKVIQQFYEFYNSNNLDGVISLMAEDCSYHDMIYAEPFVGHTEIRSYFDKVAATVPSDLKFAVDNITTGDAHAVGVKWHVDLQGHEFPFSRGASFYELNDDGKIVSARDLVEQAVKPGGLALSALAAVAPLVRKLGPNANPAVLKRLPLAAAGMWLFYAGYVYYVLLSTLAPGPPAYQTSPETLQAVLNESLNFFYVNIFLNWAGVTLVPATAAHPVSEALFNFIGAWGLMFWPLILADPKSQKVGNKVAWWGGIMFLTNIFFIPFMALRAAPEPRTGSNGSTAPPAAQASMPGNARVLAGVASVVGAISLVWAVAARPEYGGLLDRWTYSVDMFFSERVFFAFVLDAVFYTVWQAVLMPKDAPARLRYLPFVGLAVYLVAWKRRSSDKTT